jgi:transposase
MSQLNFETLLQAIEELIKNKPENKLVKHNLLQDPYKIIKQGKTYYVSPALYKAIEEKKIPTGEYKVIDLGEPEELVMTLETKSKNIAFYDNNYSSRLGRQIY